LLLESTSFFFQAEDGIRDFHVTGVQTCALPISYTLEGPGIQTIARLAPSPMPRHVAEQWAQNRARFPRGVDLILVSREGIAALRSEERRVGKECSGRRARDALKKRRKRSLPSTS